jgi:hypothetical protein
VHKPDGSYSVTYHTTIEGEETIVTMAVIRMMSVCSMIWIPMMLPSGHVGALHWVLGILFPVVCCSRFDFSKSDGRMTTRISVLHLLPASYRYLSLANI